MDKIFNYFLFNLIGVIVIDDVNIFIINNLIKCFESVGIFINDDSFDSPLILDSLQFVSLILEIEDSFLIRIGSEFFDYNDKKTFNDFYKYVFLCLRKDENILNVR